MHPPGKYAHFDVIEETPEFIVVSKPAHLLIHPTRPGGHTTLFHGLQTLLGFELANGGQISIINRLDRETSGLVLVAKTSKEARRFAKAMMRREMSKGYQAIVFGWPEQDRFTVDGPILREGDVRDCPVYVKQCVHDDGKPCSTEFEVIERFTSPEPMGVGDFRTDRFALLACKPHTGRMHQIRVHLAHVGYPIIGDKIYGPSEQLYLEFIETGWTPQLQRSLVLDRHALHSASLSCDDGNHSWTAPLATDLCDWLRMHGAAFRPGHEGA
ncbi:RluA family pseudouridine synthase [Sulfuriroseicoccus oceanibius]|uniref:RNA pseudouridine synthase n=1 Tax=Sulfuriroseicoccus oceanibius TaxID=2707525 RepID=A0A6B3LFL1_9BACT|nr:RNA pseudouridine synthase [Sulfuriroseicoccus oceanibius]QQL45457.1 RNA pseudouridine synthase [Sulfuriroseicoccus oceanibius]